jgi:nicotinamide-nucleotide amidase
MAVTSSLHVVSIGAATFTGADPEGDAVTAALAGAGVPVTVRMFVDDDEPALDAALAGEGGVTAIVAGAGGSAGDVVRRVISRATGARLSLSDRMLGALEEVHRRADRPLPRREERLAMLPAGASVWAIAGAEPAWALDVPRGVFVVLPRGAGAEALDAVVREHLVPLVRARLAGRPVTLVRILKTAGVAIADVEERLGEWLGRDGDVDVVVVPADAGEVWVRVRARGATTADAEDRLGATETQLAHALGVDCYGRDADALETVVGALLTTHGLTLAVAESCTGGLLGHRLTSVSGSSAYFERGVIVYSNEAKMEMLGVPETILRAHGAVSAPTAQAMARGICATARTPCGLSITGIAGPHGGTPEKPVGTVFIGVAVHDRVEARRFRFGGDRASVKWQSSSMALDMLRRALGGFSP